MAIFHLAAKILARTTGHNAVHAAAYRAGERLRCERTGTVRNYRHKREVSHREISAPAHVPAWAHDRSALWNHVEATEKRRDAQLSREVEVALPVELTPQQHVDLLRNYVDQAFVSYGMVADWNLHAKPGKLWRFFHAVTIVPQKVLPV